MIYQVTATSHLIDRRVHHMQKIFRTYHGEDLSLSGDHSNSSGSRVLPPADNLLILEESVEILPNASPVPMAKPNHMFGYEMD